MGAGAARLRDSQRIIEAYKGQKIVTQLPYHAVSELVWTTPEVRRVQQGVDPWLFQSSKPFTNQRSAVTQL